MNIKNFLNVKISNWYKNVEIDYGIKGHFIDAIINGDALKIVWEEEGIRYAMTFNYYKMFNAAEIWDIWMGSEWEEEAA